jgi:cellulose biosynthesis protein BcsQ
MTIVALYCNKGGVGKTAATVNLSYLAAQTGKTTLVCDLDPQGATTFYFRVKPKLKRNARGFQKGGKTIDRSIKGSDYDNLDLLPSDFTHRNLSVLFDGAKQSRRQLSKILAPLKKDYELIILDCPPTMDVLAENIFAAADYLLMPLIPTILSVRSYIQMLKFLRGDGYPLSNVYAFFNMIDGRKRMHREVADGVRDRFSGIDSAVF